MNETILVKCPIPIVIDIGMIFECNHTNEIKYQYVVSIHSFDIHLSSGVDYLTLTT